MSPEDPFAGINPERLAMMQSTSHPTERAGGGRGARGGNRGYSSRGQGQGRKITFGEGNGVVEAEASALQRRVEKKNGKKIVEEVKVEDRSKKKRKRDDEVEQTRNGGGDAAALKEKKYKKSKTEEEPVVNGSKDEKKSKGRKKEKIKDSTNGSTDSSNGLEAKLSKVEKKDAKKAAKEAKKAEKEKKKCSEEEIPEPKKSKSKWKPEEKSDEDSKSTSKSNGEKRRRPERPERPEKTEKRDKKGKKGKNDREKPLETETITAWNTSELAGDATRKTKFLRLLGVSPSTIPLATTNGARKPTTISKREKELERQFETGMKMKNERSTKKRGLGAL